ncbi:MAG: lamin tail domain-containing protein, partial [Verrucomicrobiota bacterium]
MRISPRTLYALILSGWLLASPAAVATQDSVVVINEVMYNPAGEEETGEWIELFNQNGVNVDISNWELQGAVTYRFPRGTVIPGKSYLVVAGSVDDPKLTNPMGPFEGQLANGGEEIELANNSGRVLSTLDYGDEDEWPVEADGSGATLAKIKPHSSTGEPGHWTFSEQWDGTPGAENFPSGHSAPDLFFNEVAGSETGIWVELINGGGEAVALDGHEIRTTASDATVSLDGRSIDAGGVTLLSAADLESLGVAAGDRLFLVSAGDSTTVAGVEITSRNRARTDQGEWAFPSELTPGEGNAFAFQEAIVINEIMYHHRPDFGENGEIEEFREIDEEWIELTNRSEAAVDLTGWEIRDGIRFDFPDGTSLEPGAFLVVAKDAEALRAKYPDIAVLGDFSGSLNNNSDRIRLVDANNNTADEVTYLDGGAWDRNADAAGSSLELRNPNLDNRVGQAWAASDESLKSEWADYEISGVASRAPGSNDPSQWAEFVFGLLDKGSFLIDDIRVVADPDGANRMLLRNPGFEPSLFTQNKLREWRVLGTHGSHGKTEVIDDDGSNVLHVLATAKTEHMHNHIESTLAGGEKVSVGTEYKITFRAKWLSGTPRLHTRLYFNYLADTTILKMPANHGSPGKENSVFTAAPGPVFENLTHSPAVPGANEAVTVSVSASSPDPDASYSIKWAVDGGDYQSVPMEKQGDGTYAGQIPGQGSETLVH